MNEVNFAGCLSVLIKHFIVGINLVFIRAEITVALARVNTRFTPTGETEYTTSPRYTLGTPP